MIENSTDKKFIEMDQRNNPFMTLKTLKFYCEKQSLPSQPELNEVLYLQYKGFQRIIPETISFYINLKVLHLNNNGITKIQGLHMLRQLHTLYLNNNFIQKIQGLEELHQIKVLNLSHNKLDHVSGLDNLSNLRNLNLSQNFFTKAKDLEGLLPLTNLDLLNLSQNELQASEDVFEMITELENLTVLYLKATPLCNLFKNYRKRLIYKLRKLKFLDNRPVLPNDHQLAEAWMEGGTQKQTQLKSKMIDSKRQEEERQNEDLSRRGQEKIREQMIKSSVTVSKGIVYERSQREANDSGLDSAYLPKVRTKLQKFLDSEMGSCDKKEPFATTTTMTTRTTQINEETIQKQQKAQKQQIMRKVQRILGNSNKNNNSNNNSNSNRRIPYQQQQQSFQQQQIRLRKGIEKKWNRKYNRLLQQLLVKYRFDFSQAQPSFNMIVSNINKKLMKSPVRFQLTELRYIWTEIEKQKRAQEMRRMQQMRKDEMNKEIEGCTSLKVIQEIRN